MILVLLVLVMFLTLPRVLSEMFLHTLHCLKGPILLCMMKRFHIHVVDVVVVVVVVVVSRCRDGVEMRHVQNRTLEPEACQLGWGCWMWRSRRCARRSSAARRVVVALSSCHHAVV